MRYTVKFKDAAPTAASVILTADSPADALREGARMLGMDTDPFTQTYTLTLEAIPTMNQATKNRAIECQQWAAHYSAQAAIYRQSATGQDCPYSLRAIDYQHMAQINAATARAILAD